MQMQNYTIAIDPNRTALAGFSKEWGFQVYDDFIKKLT